MLTFKEEKRLRKQYFNENYSSKYLNILQNFGQDITKMFPEVLNEPDMEH
ncbi:MAG: hypothetical protein HeimC3_51250 [Candidatus Heimdallarchaeota archaeon LC_3]|nr:MAG: hypothetical protein HeimC3_51250 [Candidatus Heimdallarchaeota archaeon LC_3]